MDYSYPLRVTANQYPDRTAVLFRDERLTYRELDRKVVQLANGLLELGLANRLVASVLLNEPITLCLYMALARINAVSVPVNVRLTASEKAYILRDAGATALVVDAEYSDQAVRLREMVPEIETILVANGQAGEHDSLLRIEDVLAGGSKETLPPGGDETGVATIMYTSGTTGFPKGVVRTHAANLWNVANSALGSPRAPEDIELFTLPIFGIGFIHFAMPALLAGATVILDRAFHPERTWQLLDQHRASRTFLAPTMVASMLDLPDHERYDLSSLEIIYSAYEFPERLRSRALERFGDRFVYMYGLTEAQLTAARPGEFASDPTSAGKPMGLMRLEIWDPQGNPLPPGEVGEIALEGPSVMAGYHHLPEATAESLREGWVLTGDLGYLDEERNLHFAGRRKEIIKTGGFSVDPREVENALLRLETIQEVAVVGVPDEHWGEMVVAFVAMAEGAALQEDELRQYCKGEMADYKVPKRVIFVEELPKNPTGKVERGRLRQMWQGQGEA